MTESRVEYAALPQWLAAVPAPGLAPDATAIIPPTEALPIWCSVAPGPRPYRLTLVDGPDDEATFRRLDRVEASCLSPHEVAERLHNLAALADLAQQTPGGVRSAGALRLLRDRLEDLAWRVVPS
jgi:hypothetical protein